MRPKQKKYVLSDQLQINMSFIAIQDSDTDDSDSGNDDDDNDVEQPARPPPLPVPTGPPVTQQAPETTMDIVPSSPGPAAQLQSSSSRAMSTDTAPAVKGRCFDRSQLVLIVNNAWHKHRPRC
jgi:hypothetical protein